MLYDITRTISPSTSVWPGDGSFRLEAVLRRADGAPVNLTRLTLSPHTGTHTDAYFHFEDEGEHPAAMPIAPYLGPARVVTVGRRGGPLRPEDLENVRLDGVERLLLRSHVSDLEDDEWPDIFPYPGPDLVTWLAGMRIQLLGVDSPSVDAFNSTDLPGHRAIRRHGMVHLEGLQLRDVPDGDYELIALPLKLDLACGSPVRAVLRTLA